MSFLLAIIVNSLTKVSKPNNTDQSHCLLIIFLEKKSKFKALVNLGESKLDVIVTAIELIKRNKKPK